MNITKQDLKEVMMICFSPICIVLLLMTFILIQYAEYMHGITLLIIVVLSVQFFLGWMNQVNYNLFRYKFQKLDKKLDNIKEWMK